jgi:hypothetical protein
LRGKKSFGKFIDVTGTTNEYYFKGVLLHLIADVVICAAEFRIDDHPWKRPVFYENVYIGRTVPPNNTNYRVIRFSASLLTIKKA